MIALSTAAIVRRSPPWLVDQPDAPVYLLRAGSVIERELFEAELSGEYRAGRVFDFEMTEAFRQGIAALMADDPGRDQILAAIAADEAGEELPATDRQMLIEARGVLSQHWPEYRELAAQAERRRQVSPALALRRFCVGFERVTGSDGKPVAFARGEDGLVTDAVLKRIPPAELRMAGIEAYGLLYGSADEGNFARPSPSDDGPQTSGSDASSTKVGRSKGRSTRKTRG